MLAKVFIDKGYFDYIVLDCYIEGVGWLGTAVFANPGGEQDFKLDTESVYWKPSPSSSKTSLLGRTSLPAGASYLTELSPPVRR